MTALKRVTVSFSSFAFAVLAVSGVYNTVVLKNDSFMAYDSGVKFVKRLDEIQGRITIGRMAASTKSWTKLAPKQAVKKEVKKIANIAPKKIEKKEFKQVKPVNVPEPAIKGDLDLTVSNVFFKQPLKQGSFTGSARTVDGVIEEIYVSLPEGDQIEINTNERMVGNVFQYEDSLTGDIRSGMLYEVKPGTYMVTLTGDKDYRYSGVRIEFQAANGAEVAYSDEYYESTQSWGMNGQNQPEEAATEYSNNEAPVDNYEYQYNNEANEPVGFKFNTNEG
jgi:hypothetical protein